TSTAAGRWRRRSSTGSRPAAEAGRRSGGQQLGGADEGPNGQRFRVGAEPQVGGVALGDDERVAVDVPGERLDPDLPVGPAGVGGKLAVVDEPVGAAGLDEAAVAAAGEDRAGQLLPGGRVEQVAARPLQEAHLVLL